MDDVEVAWLAGLLEGEGCFCRRSNGSSFVNCSMTDEDVIRKIHRIVGHGTVIMPPLKPGHKQVWMWRTGARENVESLCRVLQPHMGARRGAKIQEILDDYEENPRIRAVKGSTVHGLRSQYGKGCRCDPCRGAERAYRADLIERRNNGQVGRQGVASKPLVERVVGHRDT